MKLSSMQLVGSTVGSNRSCPTAETILEYWGFDDGSVQTVRFSTNFVFVFRQQGIKRFLRFSPAWERQVQHIQAEMELLTRLVEKGFQVAQPLRSKFGNLVETVETELGSFHAVVFTALNGKHLEVDELSASQFSAWGSALGRLHATFKGYGAGGLNRPNWRNHLDFVRDRLADDEPYIRREFETITTWVGSLPQSEQNFGLIHFDFELDNLCWDGGAAQILDFDDCSYYWYAADIALALRDLFSKDVDFEDERFKAFVVGYRSECDIDDVWLRHIPMFLRMRNLFGYASLVSSIDLSIEETHDWLKPVHEKLVKGLDMYRLSLNV